MVRGRRQLFVDTNADPEDQLERTVEALRTLPGFTDQPLRSDVQQLFEPQGRTPGAT